MLQSAINTANKQLVNANRMLQVNVHEKTNRIIVKIIDTETDEIVREIPPEKTLDLFAKVLEMAGLLLDEVK
jgi:flagellar protein FlaG